MPESESFCSIPVTEKIAFVRTGNGERVLLTDPVEWPATVGAVSQNGARG